MTAFSVSDMARKADPAANRDRFQHHWILLVALCLSLLGCSEPPPAGQVSNVVIIAIDTVRYDSLFQTERDGLRDDFSPWLERAVVFNHALAPSPWTVPSVASLMTGLYPAQHAAGRFEAEVADLSLHIPSALSNAAPTLAEMLTEADFSNFGVTAHPWFKSGYGLERGFSKIILHRGSDWLVDRAMRWVKRRDDDERWFLYVHLMEAHDWHLRVERFDGYIAEIDPTDLARYHAASPANICADPEHLICRRWVVYHHAIAFQRQEVARLLSLLEEQGALANSVVMIYADHGEEFYDHLAIQERMAVDPRGIYGFGHGQSLYQEVIRVPLLAWHPSAPGQVVEEPISLVDVVPTVFAWLGVDLGDRLMGGQDMSQWVKATSEGAFDWSVHGEAPWPRTERPLYASGIAYGPEQLSVTEEGWKYVWHELSARSDLFDLPNDPLEHHPLSDQDDRLAERRAEQLDERITTYFDWIQTDNLVRPEISAEQLEHLKGIGYLQGLDDDEGGKPTRAGIEVLGEPGEVILPGGNQDAEGDDSDEPDALQPSPEQDQSSDDG